MAPADNLGSGCGTTTVVAPGETTDRGSDNRTRAVIVHTFFWLSPLVVAAGFRLSGSDFGLPHMLHPDELGVLQPAVEWLRGGEWTFGMWKYPPTMAGLTGASAVVLGPLGMCDTGGCRPSQVLLVSRLLSVLAGVATVGLTYLASRTLEVRRGVAWLLAMVLALSPLHIQCSRYAKPDILATAAVALVLVAVARMWIFDDQPRRFRRALGLAGLASGAAAACKYNAGVIVLAPVLLAILTPRTLRERVIDVGLLAGVSLVAFILPLLCFGDDPTALVEGLRHEWMHYQQQGHGGFDTTTPLRDAVRQLAWFGLGIVPILAAFPGVVALSRSQLRPVALALGTTLGVMALLVGMQSVFFARLTLPWLPLLAVWTALAIEHVYTSSSHASSRVWAGLLAVAMLGQGAWMSYRQAVLVAQPDSRRVAGEWLKHQLPANARVALMPGTYYGPAPAPAQSHPMTQRDLDYLRKRGFTHVVYSSGGDARYALHPQRFRQQASEVSRFRSELRRRGNLLLQLHPPPIPGHNVFGVTVGLYHQPRIEVYELPKLGQR